MFKVVSFERLTRRIDTIKEILQLEPVQDDAVVKVDAEQRNYRTVVERKVKGHDTLAAEQLLTRPVDGILEGEQLGFVFDHGRQDGHLIAAGTKEIEIVLNQIARHLVRDVLFDEVLEHAAITIVRRRPRLIYVQVAKDGQLFGCIYIADTALNILDVGALVKAGRLLVLVHDEKDTVAQVRVEDQAVGYLSDRQRVQERYWYTYPVGQVNDRLEYCAVHLIGDLLLVPVHTYNHIVQRHGVEWSLFLDKFLYFCILYNLIGTYIHDMILQARLDIDRTITIQFRQIHCILVNILGVGDDVVRPVDAIEQNDGVAVETYTLSVLADDTMP